MTSIDELFKTSSVAGKRKLEVSHDPSHYYKSAKLSANGDVKGKSHATVEDDPEEIEDEDDVEAGPALPPDEDEDYGPEAEEGRFFGGGVDKNQREALDFIEQQEKAKEDGEVVYDVKWLRKLASNLEKRIAKNADLRAKYEDDPEKFMASEADLDDEIKALSVLAEHPELYEDFAKLGCVESLVGLLAHENVDIAIDAIEILSQLLTEDVQAGERQLDAVVHAVMQTDLFNLIAANLKRLNENEETDRNGVTRALSILATLASRPATAERLAKEDSLVDWLLMRIQNVSNAMVLLQNKQSAAETLSSLVDNNVQSRQELIKRGAVNTFLELLAPYRRHYPTDETEAEYVENVFDALTLLVDDPEGKSKFLEAEGVELMLIFIRESKLAKAHALGVLDHAMGGAAGAEVCMTLVEKQGLKSIFGTFMKTKPEEMTEVVERILGIFVSLLRSLSNDSAERIRTLAKFVEKGYEKIEQLLKIRSGYGTQLRQVGREIAQERKRTAAKDVADMEIGWLAMRLDAGLLPSQVIDEILAWLIAEDGGAKKKIISLLQDRGESLNDIKKTLQEQVKGMTDADEETKVLKDILTTLIPFLTA